MQIFNNGKKLDDEMHNKFIYCIKHNFYNLLHGNYDILYKKDTVQIKFTIIALEFNGVYFLCYNNDILKAINRFYKNKRIEAKFFDINGSIHGHYYYINTSFYKWNINKSISIRKIQNKFRKKNR